MNTTDVDCTDAVHQLALRVEQDFQTRWSRLPSCIVAAPGRVNLIGEHIDYNDGFVLPMAIERHVTMAAAPHVRESVRSATFYSVDQQEAAVVPLDRALAPSKGWPAYLEGVIAGFMERGFVIPSFDAIIRSNVPLGGGLSSSAALEVATATLLEALTEKSLPPTEKALLCQQAEHTFAGVPCGIMDQFSTVFGKRNELMLLDCRSQQIQAIPFAADEITVLIINSKVKHELAGGEYAQRRAQCDAALEKLNQSTWRDVTVNELQLQRAHLSDTEYLRARHVVSEIARTKEAAEAFRSGDWTRAGELMDASHASLRDDYQVSCRELDLLVELAQETGVAGGVLGSRMTGGGFGGCTVSLVRRDNVEAIRQRLVSRYAASTGIKPHSFASRPARGAQIIRG